MPRLTLKARAFRDTALDDKTGAAQPEGSFITVHGHPIFIPAEQGSGKGGGKSAARPKESPEELAARTERVMGKLPKIAEAIPKVREQVHADLQKDDAQKERVAAVVARIMDATTMRVGSEKFAQKSAKGAAGQDSFGASSLRKEHVSVEGNTVTFNFPGKSRKNWERSVTDPHLAEAVRHLQTLPGEKLMQYHAANGEIRPFNENHANEYLGQHGITAKNFRTYHASRIAAEHLAAAGTPRTHEEAKAHINAAVKAVSEHLGNTPAIARQSYINPTILEHHASKVPTSAQADAALDGPSMEPGQGSEEWFNNYLHALQEGVKRGALKGVDPYPADCGEPVGDDEDGLEESEATALPPSADSASDDAETTSDLEDAPTVPRCKACGAFANDNGDCSVCGSGVLTPDPMFVQPLTYGHGTPGTDGLPLADSLLADTPDDSGVVLLSDAKKDGLGRYRQLGTIADIVNLNKRRYPRKVLDKALEPARERAHAGAMLGNLVHPRVVSDGYEEHYVDEPHRRATQITDIGTVQKDGRVFIDFKILDTPCGRILKDSFVRGKPYGPSTRFVVPEKAFHREGDVLVTDEMDIHTWDHVINPAVAETSREYTALSDSLRADLGLAGGSPVETQGRPASGVFAPGRSDARRRYKMEPIGILNRCWALFNGRAPAAEIKAVRQMAVDAIAKAGEAGEDVSDVSAKLAHFDATIEKVPGYSGGTVTLVHGNDTGTNGAGTGYAPEITDTSDQPVTGRPPIEDKDKVDGLTTRGMDEATTATLAWAKEQMERQKAAADAEALKAAVSDAIEAAKDLPELAKLNADAREMVLSQVRSGAQNAEQVPTLIADSVALYMKAAAAERLAGGGLVAASGNTVSDPGRPGGYHPAEVTRESMPWMVETEKLLAAADDFGASQINNPGAVVQRTDRELQSIRKYNRQGAMGEPGFIDDILLPEFTRRYKGVAASDSNPREAVRQWFERDDAIMLAQRGQGSGRNFTDEFVKPALAMMDATTTSNLLNQPTIFTAILVQMFWNLRALQFVQGVGPGMGMAGNRGWYNHDGGIGTVLRIPTESMAWGSGLAQKPQRNYIPAGAFAEDAGISPINFALRWLSFVPAMFKAAISLTKEAELSLGQGPLNYPAWGRALYWLGVSKSLNLDPLMFNEMYNVSDEYGAVAVPGETATLADNSVYNGSGSITVNLNPKKLASAVVAAGDPFVTYGANVVGAIRLNCAGAGNTSPYCGNPGSSTVSGVLAAGTLQPPIVRPRSVTTFDGSGNPTTTVTNPVTLTAPASQVQGFLDDTNNIAAGTTASPVWAVDYVHGCLVFTSGLSSIAGSGGVMTAPATVTVSYSYATNFDAYQVNNLNLPAGVTVEDYMNGLVNQLNFTAAYMAGPGRYSPPDLALMGVGAAPNIERASIFWNRASPTGTELFPTESYFARRNGIDMARFNSPVQVGDNRILLTRRGTTIYAVDEPFNTDGPWPSYDPTSGNIKDTKTFMGRERYCIATPMAQDANGNITNPPSRSIVPY